MVYKLDDADKLCGVTYIDWSKKYSKIPKATCETIKQQCSSGGGGSSDDALDLSCEEIKKLLKGEDKPKEDKPKEDTPNEGNKEETPKENETPTEDKPQENPTEPTPEPPVADTPREDTPTEGNASDHSGDTPTGDTPEVNLLELMPKVEGEFSIVAFQDGIVSYVIEDSQKQKEDFENNIITTLRGKLPEGAVVEAVLGEPYYKEGSEYPKDRTNYTLHVRVTLNGKVYEQEYPVQHTQRALSAVVDSF